MARRWGWTVVAAGLGLALVAGPATRADEKDKDDERRVRRRAEVVHIGSGYLGVGIEDVGADDASRLKLPAENGALVTRVEEGSPAAKAGLQKDDVIVRFGGENVRSASNLMRLVRETPEGRKVEIELLRGGAAQRVQATIDEVAFGDEIRREIGRAMAAIPRWLPEPPEAPEAPEAPTAPKAPRAPRVPRGPMFDWRQGDAPMVWFHGFDRGPRKLGVTYQDVEGQLGQFLKVPGGKGVLVTEVEADSPAAKAGLKAGDVIVKFAGEAIAGGDDFRDAVGKAESGTEVVVGVSREGKPLELKATLGGDRERRRMRRGASAT